jgi:hypothetical protein
MGDLGIAGMMMMMIVVMRIKRGSGGVDWIQVTQSRVRW